MELLPPVLLAVNLELVFNGETSGPRSDSEDKAMPRTFLICGVFLVFVSLGQAADLTSIDLMPKTDWSYFYNSNNVADADLDEALRTSGFYDNWTSPDFVETDVAGLSWQTGAIPIGFRNSSPSVPTPLVTSVDLPTATGERRTMFLRRDFFVPEGMDGPFGLQLHYEHGATVYLDGQEISRVNCCVDAYRQNPIVGPPQFLDYADSLAWRQTHITSIADLAPGEHTIAVSLHASDQENRSQQFRSSFDMRVFSAGNENPWVLQDWQGNWGSSNNWLFGVPDANDFAVIRYGAIGQILNSHSVSIAGLKIEGNTNVVGAGNITLGSSETEAKLIVSGRSEIENRLQIDNDITVQVDKGGSLSITGLFEGNGRTIRKTGDGLFIIPPVDHLNPDTLPMEVLLEAGTLVPLSPSRFHGNITSTGGNLHVGSRTLTVSGSVDSPTHISLFGGPEGPIGGPQLPNGKISGTGSGELIIPELTVQVPLMFHPSNGSYELFLEWESIEVGDVRLPNIGLAEWDTSQISDGVLSIKNTEIASCDLDMSGRCDLTDINQLLDDIYAGEDNPQSDLNNDGVVDVADRDEWLVSAGRAIGLRSFLAGDVNFDGSVDAQDLMTIGQNWQSVNRGWQNGDFNADGLVDSKDLNIVGMNWIKSVERLPNDPAPANAVPEPVTHLMLLVGAIGLYGVARRAPKHAVVSILIVGFLCV